MTQNIQRTASAAHVALNLAVRPAREAEPPMPTLSLPDGPAAPPLRVLAELSSLGREFSEAFESGDPMLVLQAAASRIRTARSQTAQATAQGASATARQELHEQLAALERAIESSKTAGIFDVFVKIGQAIATVAGIVASVAGAAFSGGLSVVGGIACAAALVAGAGSGLMQIMEVAGANIDPGISLAITAALAAISLGAGVAQAGSVAARGAQAAVGAARAAQSAAAIGRGAASITAGAASVLQGAATGIATGFHFDEANHRANATEHSNRRESALDRQTEATDLMRNVLQAYQRITSRISATLSAQNQTTALVVANLARA